MIKTLILILTLSTMNVFGQNDPTEEAQPIVAEGKLLYRSEMDVVEKIIKDQEKRNKKKKKGG